MPVPLTGSGGLFTRLGKIAKAIRFINQYQNDTLAPRIEEIMAAFETLRVPVSQVPLLAQSGAIGAASPIGTLQQAAQQTLLTMINNDAPRSDKNTIALAAQELIDQMRAASQTVKSCVVSVSATARTGNTGNGAAVVSSRRSDGLFQENQFAETAVLTCLGDAQSGTATAGSEPFVCRGQFSQPDVFASDWPRGSGATAALTAIDGSLNASANVLTNSSFENWTGADLDRWEITTGTYGTNAVKENTSVYDGTASLKIVGGATLTAIRQTFNDASGTTGQLQPLTQYAINVFARVNPVPAAGVLTIELIDGAGSVINDESSNPNSFTIDLTALTTSWTARNGVFRTPRVLPSTIRLRLRISTALSSGSDLFLDRLAFGRMVEFYRGGPSLAVFSGNTPWVRDDSFNVTTTNDRGGSTFNSTFQTVFDRLFGMRQLDLLLPSGSSPTIADTLITS